MYVKLGMKREFLSAICVYEPGMERSEEERDIYWEELKGVYGSVFR